MAPGTNFERPGVAEQARAAKASSFLDFPRVFLAQLGSSGARPKPEVRHPKKALMQDKGYPWIIHAVDYPISSDSPSIYPCIFMHNA